MGTKEAARPPAPASVVHYGRKAAQLDNRATTAAKPGAYVQTYPNATYSSPYFHRVRLTGLEAGETYHYKVGSDKGGWSSVRSFRAPPGPTNNPRYPLRLVVVGDLGATVNTTSTLDHVAISDGDAALNLGDFVYADNFTPNNALRVLTPPTSPNGTYQPRWDAWGRLVSPVFASLPFAPLPGNHEVETDANGKQWQAYTNRLAPDGPTWYSTTIGPVHVAVLDSYAGWAVGTKQADWLAKDLASVDRSATPWVIVAMHAPWYSSYYKHYKTVECMRIALEPIMVEHGVDLVFAGHIHAYERSHRTVAWKPSACGPYHITAGEEREGRTAHACAHPTIFFIHPPPTSSRRRWQQRETVYHVCRPVGQRHDARRGGLPPAREGRRVRAQGRGPLLPGGRARPHRVPGAVVWSRRAGGAVRYARAVDVAPQPRREEGGGGRHRADARGGVVRVGGGRPGREGVNGEDDDPGRWRSIIFFSFLST